MCRAFDVELLYIAQTLNMPIKEVAVNWQEIDGETYCQHIITSSYRLQNDTNLQLAANGA